MSVWVRRGQPALAGRSLIMPRGFVGFASDDFQSVSVTSVDDALRVVAVRSAADMLCSLVSELPGDVRRGRDVIPTPGYLDDPDGSGNGLADWTYRLVLSWLLRGNAYGTTIQASPLGVPTQVALHHPDRVACTVLDGVPSWRIGGRDVTDADGFLHWRVNPIPGQILGLSIIGQHAVDIEIPLTATRYGRQWFKDGAHPSGILTNDQLNMSDLTVDQRDTVKASFMAKMRGTREPALLGRGWTYKQLQTSPEESQFLGTLGYGAAECARMFGPGVAEILGYETGGGMTYANAVDRMNHLLILTLNRWIRRTERVLSGMLPVGQTYRYQRGALMETTTMQRYQAHAVALQNRFRTVNEIRAVEGDDPVAWGDEPNTGSSAAKNLVEMVQKVYLGVGKVISTAEAREMLNAAGAGLVPNGDVGEVPK